MDRTTKILLAAIALGLWANAATTMMPSVVRSAHGQQRMHYSVPVEIANDLEKAVTLIANGGCNNVKLC
jgi:hypothetical protein